MEFKKMGKRLVFLLAGFGLVVFFLSAVKEIFSGQLTLPNTIIVIMSGLGITVFLFVADVYGIREKLWPIIAAVGIIVLFLF